MTKLFHRSDFIHGLDTTGEPTCFKQKFIFRQQFHADDDLKLAGFLNLQKDEVEDYDVFVYKLCEENISEESAHGLGEDDYDYDYDDVY